MSLLDSMPHRCAIFRMKRAKGSLGGSKDTPVSEQTDVECWEQHASSAEAELYQKRGMSITGKIYFPTDPGVTTRHLIQITAREGVAVTGQPLLEVRTRAAPDASAGMGVVFRVMVEDVTSKDN